ncbi:hypothetical protein NPIL_268661 [Nephila pilipes]|uniref:Uncharacterized protein n=1 Tax=Nephila pilipes TaxID=299642 RepID=A0A8X6NJE6_NEPPI|nr:hypothetical protein NPIL_268661 [Nephila pilipes]
MLNGLQSPTLAFPCLFIELPVSSEARMTECYRRCSWKVKLMKQAVNVCLTSVSGRSNRKKKTLSLALCFWQAPPLEDTTGNLSSQQDQYNNRFLQWWDAVTMVGTPYATSLHGYEILDFR